MKSIVLKTSKDVKTFQKLEKQEGKAYLSTGLYYKNIQQIFL